MLHAWWSEKQLPIEKEERQEETTTDLFARIPMVSQMAMMMRESVLGWSFCKSDLVLGLETLKS
jgi:hypothetical protein